MLKNTFLHIPYISEKTEKKFWQDNIRTWDDFLSGDVECSNCRLIKKHLTLSKENYDKKNHEFFSKKLLSKYHWRAYDDFRDRTCFLDIETTGLSRDRSEITVIGLYDGHESKVFVNGVNMHEFEKEMEKYSYIVTFNGSLFDLPFIKNKFPDLKMDQFHADLRWVLKRLGYKGGLKKIEKEFAIDRQSEVSGFSGRDAIKLWYRYKRGNDRKALDLLVKYNIEDIENLKVLMDHSYDKLREKNWQS